VVLRSVVATCAQLGVRFEEVAAASLIAHARAGPEGAPPSPKLVQALQAAIAKRGTASPAVARREAVPSIVSAKGD
jgi:hypothetical protein